MRGLSRRTVLPSAAAIALIAAGMVAVSGPALAADTATINMHLDQQRCRPTSFPLNGTAGSDHVNPAARHRGCRAAGDCRQRVSATLSALVSAARLNTS